MQRHSSSDSQAVLLQEIANQRKAIAMLIETCKALSQAMEFRIDDPRHELLEDLRLLIARAEAAQ